MNIKLTLKGAPITKKNSMRIIRVRNRPMIMPSQQYKDYEGACIFQIPHKVRHKIDMPVNVQCVYYMPTKRRCDLVNLLEATCDILTRAEVLADDHCRIVAAHDGSRVLYDKENPRVEVTITSYHGEVLE